MSRTKKMITLAAALPKTVQAAQAIAKTVMKISHDAVSTMRIKPRAADPQALVQQLFKPYKPLPGVLPASYSYPYTHPGMALDAAGFAGNAYLDGLGADMGEAYQQGYAFPGFQVLAQWAQITEYRKPAETFAREMTRKWGTIKAVGAGDKSEKIKRIEQEFERLQVQAVFREAIEQDGFFGRSQIFLDMGAGIDATDPRQREELKSELALSAAKVNQSAPIKRLVVVEPSWSYPNNYNASNPLDATFYKPTSWFVMATEVHASRLLTVISREVPDILKPAYAFSGLSLSQMMKPYVDNWLRTRQSVSDLIHSFTVWVLKTDLGSILNNGAAESLFNRLQIFNAARDNHGVNVINRDSEEFQNVSASLAGLDRLQAQAQEHMCAPCSMPLVYLTGITPSGLNASSEGEIEVWQDNIAAQQQMLNPHLKTILDLVQLSSFGEIDPDIYFAWEPLRTMSPKERAEIEKIEAETDAMDIKAGALQVAERRAGIANREDSRYAGLVIEK